MRNFCFKALNTLSLNLQKISRPTLNHILIDSSRVFIVSPWYQQHSLSVKSVTSQRLYCGCVTRSCCTLSQSKPSIYSPLSVHRHCSTSGPTGAGNEKSNQKPSLYQRFKTMYKQYWYVLVPVHLVTSAGWFGGFYYMASSGFDIVAMLEWVNVNDKLIEPFRNGHAKTGYLAIAYTLYKIATPLRYTVTLGGTTLSINYLKKWGLIKPVPSTEKLKEIYQDKKGQIMEKGQSLKDNVIQSLKPSESKKKNP